MGQTVLMDGRQVASSYHPSFSLAADFFKKKTGILPFLVVFRVGMDGPSGVYVKNKEKLAQKLGMGFMCRHLPADVSEKELLSLIDACNADASVHGIIIQLPISEHLDKAVLLERIHPEKDVDGLHSVNRGRLFSDLADKGQGGYTVPCTPWGCLQLLQFYGIQLPGAHSVVIGRSSLVGRPLAALLLKHHSTVTLVHRRTKDLEKITSQADILCVAAGQKSFIGAHHIKKGSVVLDIGIHKEKESVVGDVRTDEVMGKASFVTPVPGGVGPLTVTGLMHNTLKCAYRQAEVSLPSSLENL